MMIGTGNMLNQDTKKLALAIRQHESGGNYNAQGGSGENGAYQFMPSTWKSWANTHLGNSNAEQTPQNQNKVAYMQIQSLKDKGYTPEQIASTWNSGGPSWEGKVGTNKYGVRYDVPSYVRNVMANYKSGVTTTTQDTGPKSPDFWKRVDEKRKEQYSDTEILNKLSEKNKNISKITRMSRDRYGAEGSGITNDRELLNALSEKLSGQNPTVESNPDYAYLEEESNRVLENLKQFVENKVGEQDERVGFGTRLSDVAKIGPEVKTGIWEAIKSRGEKIGESLLAMNVPFTDKDEKAREGVTSSLTGEQITGQSFLETGLQIGAESILAAGDIAWEVIKGLGKSSNAYSGGAIKRKVDPTTKEFMEDISQFMEEAPKGVIKNIRSDKKFNVFGVGGEEIADWLEDTSSMIANKLKTDDRLRRNLGIPMAAVDVMTFKASKPAREGLEEGLVASVRGAKEATGEILEETGTAIKKGLQKQKAREAIDITQPKMTERYKNEVLDRLDKKGQVVPNKWEKEVAESVADIVDINKKPEINIKRIRDDIGKISENVKENLEANNAIFNKVQLRTAIDNGLKQVDDIMIPEARLDKLKTDITDGLMAKIQKHNLSNLWDARIKFDKYLDDKLKAFGGQFTIKKDVARAVRDSVNKFIIKKSPNGKIYEEGMSKMTRMYSAIDNIKSKVKPSLIGETKLKAIGRNMRAFGHKIGLAGMPIGAGGVLALSAFPTLFTPAVMASILAYGSYKIGKKVVTSKMLREFLSDLLIKAGKNMNPEEKKLIRQLIEELEEAQPGMTIKDVSNKGFQKLPGKTSTLTDNISKAKAEGKSFDELKKIKFSDIEDIDVFNNKVDKIIDSSSKEELTKISRLGEDLMISSQNYLENGAFTKKSAFNDFRLGQHIRYKMSKLQKEKTVIEKANRMLAQEKRDIELRKTDINIDKLTSKDTDFLTKQARKHKTFDEFLQEMRGSASQYGEYQPQLRKYINPDSKKLSDIKGFKDNDMITIYRGIDGSRARKINTGDFVTMDYDDALGYTSDASKVVSQRVRAKNLITEYPDEIVHGEDIYELIYNPSTKETVKITDTKLKQLWDKQ